MELTINGKAYSFKFGVKFVREVDKRKPVEQNGVQFGMGLVAKVVPELHATNIATLADVLYMANQTESPKIKQSELDDYIDDCDDIEALFDEVINELSESNAGKLAMQRTKEKIAKQ